MNDKEWFTTAEAARFLESRGVRIFNPRTKTWRAPTQGLVRLWCARGRFTTRRIADRYYLIARSALQSFAPPRVGRPRVRGNP